jgi:putative transposase
MGDRLLEPTPRTNAIAQRWIDTVRHELLNRMLIVHRRPLEHALADYIAHVNHHRPHRASHQAAPLRPLPPPGHNLTFASDVAIGSAG